VSTDGDWTNLGHHLMACYALDCFSCWMEMEWICLPWFWLSVQELGLKFTLLGYWNHVYVISNVWVAYKTHVWFILNIYIYFMCEDFVCIVIDATHFEENWTLLEGGEVHNISCENDYV
jgi:hypothetical protein